MTATAQEHRLIDALLARYGSAYAEQCGITLRDTPAPLFQLLMMSALMGAPIRASAAIQAMHGLLGAGWTTPEHVNGSTWARRTRVLNAHGYARFDESGSRMLGRMAEQLADGYHGDLRRVHAAAEGDVRELHRRLQEFQGIGPVGASIFLREVQQVWPDVHPFADDRALRTATELGLPDTPEGLAQLVRGTDRFALLVSALVQADLDHAIGDLRASH